MSMQCDELCNNAHPQHSMAAISHYMTLKMTIDRQNIFGTLKKVVLFKQKSLIQNKLLTRWEGVILTTKKEYFKRSIPKFLKDKVLSSK